MVSDRVRTDSGIYLLLSKIDLPIEDIRRLGDRNFLVYYAPSTQKVQIRIVPNYARLLLLEMHSKNFSLNLGKRLRDIFEDVDVILTTGIFLKDNEYVCEMVLSFTEEEGLKTFENSLSDVETVEFKIFIFSE